MALHLSPRDQLDAELRHRYSKLCSRYGAAAVQPPWQDLIDAYTEVVEAARSRGVGAAVAAVQSAGESYEFIVRRLCDPVWRGMVNIAMGEKTTEAERR